MDEFEQSLERASQTLSSFVEQHGQEAATTLERAFGRAGASIEQALDQAAQSGELNFRRMTEAILTDLARVAAETVIAQSGLGQSNQTLNVNLGGRQPAAQAPLGGAGLETLVATAAARGARYA